MRYKLLFSALLLVALASPVHGQILIQGSTLVDIREFTTSGTWTMPTGWTVAAADVYMVGGGGGGGGGRGNDAGGNKGSGGGAAMYVHHPSVILTSSITVTIGLGGTGGTGGTGGHGANGSAGGTTSFGDLIAPGGSLGVGSTAPAVSGNSVDSAVIASAGAPNFWTVNNAISPISLFIPGPSGNTPGNSGLYAPGAYIGGTGTSRGGGGGGSLLGKGGDGAAGTTGTNGSAGTGYGAGGGGGAHNAAANPGGNGGAGSNGYCLVVATKVR